MRPATPSRTKKEIEARKIAKYEQAVAAYDEWKSLHPKGAILTSEKEAERETLERAVDRAESALQPQECNDCGTYCNGSCPCDPYPMESLREQQYRSMLASVQRWAGVVTFEDRLRARLSVGSYRYQNTDAIISALRELAATERVVISTDSDGITWTNERGHSWFLLPVDFVDCGNSDVATFEDDFLAEIRGGENSAAVELDQARIPLLPRGVFCSPQRWLLF
jgi:hypothetical protein